MPMADRRKNIDTSSMRRKEAPGASSLANYPSSAFAFSLAKPREAETPFGKPLRSP